MQVLGSSSCCGLVEISELRDLEKPADALWRFTQSFERIKSYHPTVKVLDNLPYQVLFDGVQRFITPPEVKMPNREQYYTTGSYGPKKGQQTFREEAYNAAVASAKKEVLFGYAGRFADYIKRNHLGRLFEIPTQPNHNYLNHVIEVYIWHPNHAKLRAWWAQESKKRPESTFGDED